MSDRPLIGVTGSRRRGRIMTFLNQFAVWRAGGRSVSITWDKPYPIDQVDGNIIGGGDDISVTLYGGAVALDIRVDPRRDDLEIAALDVANKHNIPVLGICRGSQILIFFTKGACIAKSKRYTKTHHKSGQ